MTAYYPVTISDLAGNFITAKFWLVDICSRLSCIDEAGTDTEIDLFGADLDYKSLCKVIL
jgi:hypothetical protein